MGRWDEIGKLGVWVKGLSWEIAQVEKRVVVKLGVDKKGGMGVGIGVVNLSLHTKEPTDGN